MKPEKPMFTAKEIREMVKEQVPIVEAIEILDEMKHWYFRNLHLITIGEEYAFKNEINKLNNYILNNSIKDK